jgi:hypothetical protein
VKTRVRELIETGPNPCKSPPKPESSKYIDEQFGHLPAEVTHKVTCENAGRFYGLMR